MRLRILLPLLLTVCLLTGCASENTGSYRQISMDEATAIMAEESGYIILDVRTQSEYNTGHIPGAICIPNEDIASGMFTGLPDKGQLILVYCRSGNRSN